MRMIAGPPASLEVILTLRTTMVFDKSLYEQFLIYLIFSMEICTSITTGRSVLDDLLEFFPTLDLTLAALIVSLAAGIVLGVTSATRRSRSIRSLNQGFLAHRHCSPGDLV